MHKLRASATAALFLTPMLLVGCSSSDGGAGSSGGSIPVLPSPTPQIQPAAATLDVTPPRFSPFANALGDKLEAINLTVTTNIPQPFYLQVEDRPPQGVFGGVNEGDHTKECTPGGLANVGCRVNGKPVELDFWCSNQCPTGNYEIRLLVCSYQQDGAFKSCSKQDSQYLDWVGKLGAKLQGNPLATPDPDHSAILNLYKTVSFTH